MEEIGARARKKDNGIEMETIDSIVGMKKKECKKWHVEVSLSLLI